MPQLKGPALGEQECDRSDRYERDPLSAERLDTGREQRIHEAAIEVKPGMVDLARARRDDARPGPEPLRS